LLAELLPDHSRWSGVGEEGEDFVCDVTFEAADDVAIRESFGSAPLKILHCARVVVAVSDENNAMDGMVCTAVTTAGEAVTHTLARRSRDRRNTTQGSELCFAVDPFRVIADGCEQRRGDDWSYSVGIEQRRVQLSDERVELQIESDDVVTQILVSNGETFERLPSDVLRVDAGTGPCLSDDGDQFFAAVSSVVLSDRVVRGDEQRMNLVHGG